MGRGRAFIQGPGPDCCRPGTGRPSTTFTRTLPPRRSTLSSDLQVWFSGRDFIDWLPAEPVTGYWQNAINALIRFAIKSGRSNVVLLSDQDGGDIADAAQFVLNSPDLPGSWLVDAYVYDGGIDPTIWPATYLTGGGGGIFGFGLTPQTTGVIITDMIWQGTSPVGLLNPLKANTAVLRSFLQAGGALGGWSEIYDGDPEIGCVNDTPLVLGWTWLPLLFPGMVPVTTTSVAGDYQLTAAGARLVGGDPSGGDTEQSAFRGDLNGLEPLVVLPEGVIPVPCYNGPFQCDIGGVPNNL